MMRTTYELDLLVKDTYSVTLDLRSLIFASITLGSIGALLDLSNIVIIFFI